MSGQRHLAFAEIGADRLPQRPGVTREVEQIVHELEGDAEIEPVLAERLRLLLADLPEHAADLRAAAEEIRGLAPDDVEVLLLGDVGVAVLRELVELALDHAQRDVAQQPDDVEGIVGERQRHRLDVEIVAQQHRDVVAPARVHREPAAAQLGFVDDVVVHERGGVDELDDGRIQDGALALVAGQARGHQQDGGTDPFTAARLDVLADLGDQIDLGFDLTAEFAIHLLQVGANRFEDL